jgi:hypothetical protein
VARYLGWSQNVGSNFGLKTAARIAVIKDAFDPIRFKTRTKNLIY